MQIGECRTENADFTDAVVNGIVSSPPLAAWFPDIRLSKRQLTSTRSYKIKDLNHCVICGDRERNSDRRSHYDFRAADLRDATLVGGDFSDCDFADAQIAGTSSDCVRFPSSSLLARKTSGQDDSHEWSSPARLLQGESLSRRSILPVPSLLCVCQRRTFQTRTSQDVRFGRQSRRTSCPSRGIIARGIFRR